MTFVPYSHAWPDPWPDEDPMTVPVPTSAPASTLTPMERAHVELTQAALGLGQRIERQAVIEYLRKLPDGVAPSAIAAAIELDAHDPERARQKWVWAGEELPASGDGDATQANIDTTSQEAPCQSHSTKAAAARQD